MPSLSEAAVIVLAGIAVCLAVGRLAIRWLARAQYVAPVRYEDCPPLQAYQEAKHKTPTMGGLFLLGAAIATAVVAGGLAHRNGWLVLGAVLGLGAIGLLDDWLKFRGPNGVGLRSAPKLLAALAVGAAIGMAASGGPAGAGVMMVPWLGRSIDLGWAWVPFSMIVVAGSAHAVNLTDGMDGLAAGCAAITFAALAVFSLTGDASQRALMPWCAALSGACIGFLWFNCFPASIYMGDVGALGLGAGLGAVSLLSQSGLWLLVIGGVFVAEALSVMLQVASYKWRNKQRIFRVAPIHHHFHLGGMSEPKVIVRFWLVSMILALLGLTTVGVRTIGR